MVGVLGTCGPATQVAPSIDLTGGDDWEKMADVTYQTTVQVKKAGGSIKKAQKS